MAATREFSSSMSTPQSGSASLNITVNGTTTNYNPFGPNRAVTIDTTTGGETLLDGGALEPQYVYKDDYSGYAVTINVPDNHHVYSCTIIDDDSHSNTTCGITIVLPVLSNGAKPIVQVKLALDMFVAADAEKMMPVYVKFANNLYISPEKILIDSTWVSRNQAQYPEVDSGSLFTVTIIGDTFWVG